MKRIIASFLILALLTPTFALAAVTVAPQGNAGAPPPIDSSLAGSPQFAADQQLTQTQSTIAGLTDTGQVVGCQTGGFGGALANAFGVALQQAIPQLLRSKLGGLASKLAAKAGPFAPVVNAISNIAINKLSTFVQNKIGSLVNGITGSLGGTLGSVVSGVGLSGAVGLAVPISLDPNTQFLKDTSNTQNNTDKTAQATETVAQKKCIGDPLVNKIKNAILALITKGTLDFVSNGFDGQGAIIQDLLNFAHQSVQDLTRDFLTKALSGLCSPYQQDVQQIVLTQYQYEDNFGTRVQCSNGGAKAAAAAASGEYDPQVAYDTLFHPQDDPYYAYLVANDELHNESAAQQQADLAHYQASGGYRDQIKCTDGGTVPKGSYCEGGVIVTPGSTIASNVNHTLNLGQDQLLNADEVGELVDALTSSLSQVAFSSLDGLVGLSKKNGSQGSYLDNMVTAATGGASDAATTAITSDIDAALTVEQQYKDTLTTIRTQLLSARTGYTAVFDCYKPKANGADTNATTKMNNASSTIATIIDPQIKNLTIEINKSQNAIDQLTILGTQALSALSADEITATNQSFVAYVASGAVHTQTDLTFLQNDLPATENATNILKTDATALLAECVAGQ